MLVLAIASTLGEIMRTIRAFAVVFLLIAVVMVVMAYGAAEQAAVNGEEFPWKLFYGPLYPLGAVLVLTMLHEYLTPSRRKPEPDYVSQDWLARHGSD